VDLKCSAEILSSVPKHKKAVMDFLEKKYLLVKLYSGIDYTVVGYMFNINELTKNNMSLKRNAHQM
jgi:hypothetical protein